MSELIATDAREAARLLGKHVLPETRGTTCFYFAAEQPPLPGPDLVLNGEGVGLINSLLVPSNLSEHFAPPGQHLVTVNLFGTQADPDQIEPRLRSELVDWFGEAAKTWNRLAVYRLAAALPRQASPTPYPCERDVRVTDRLWICSELGGAPSIQWALHSGTRAGQSVSAELVGPDRSR